MPEASDQLTTALLAFGLRRGLVTRATVVEWADRQIAQREYPPQWLIEVSMSAGLHLLDLISILNKVGDGADRVEVCRAILSIMPDMSQENFAALERRAEVVYSLIFDALDGNWTYAVLSEADEARDNFDWQREGYIKLSEGEVIDKFHSFIERYRDPQIRSAVAPILFDISKE